MPESVFGVASVCREAAETMALLDAVMDGLTNEDNGALRDLCATQVSLHHGPTKYVCRQQAFSAQSLRAVCGLGASYPTILQPGMHISPVRRGDSCWACSAGRGVPQVVRQA